MSDTTNFSHDDMIRKVAALLATAESFAEQGNDEAASSYVEKAHQLQSKWSIDQAMIDEINGTKTEKIVSKHIPMPGKWGKRKVNLTHVIAKNTGCTGYFRTGYGTKMGPGLTEVTDWDGPKVYYYVVFGFESDVEHVEYLLNSLARQMDVALEHARKENRWEHHKTFGASFCNGFISSIGFRLGAAKRQAQAEARQQYDTVESNTSVSLVLASKSQQVEDEMRARVGKLGKGSASTSNSYSAYNAGKDAGSRATIARGSVGGSSKGSLNR